MSRVRHLKSARETMRLARREGFADIRIDYRHAHPVLRATKDGAPVKLVIPRTPSDWRGKRNCLAQMRRIARGAQL
jgi:hypothetical protein